MALDGYFMILMMIESCERGRGYFLVSVLGRFSRAFYLHSAPFFLEFFTSQCPPFFLETSFLSSFLPVHPLSYVSIILMPMSWGCFCWCLMMLVMRREKWYQHLLIRIISSSGSAHQDHLLISSSAEIMSCFDNSYDS